jgi:Protein of unknown function (DUF2950)
MSEGVTCTPIATADLKAVRRRTPVAAGEGEGAESRGPFQNNRPDKPMKPSIQLTRLAGLLTPALWAGAWSILSSNLCAAEPKDAQPQPVVAQRLFASPEEAIKTLRAAAEAKDKPGLRQIFGPEFDELVTGDEVQDGNNARRFAAALAQGCQPVKEGEDKITLEVGTNNWPMPIPLVKAGGQWHFDTAAGKDEIINRHIGKDELHAIGVCRAYVTAQRQYANAIPKVGGGANYAQKFKSTPGRKDGLYWPAAENETASPFGPLVAEAHAEGYGKHLGTGPRPFHGYYFRILTRQGKAAPGGKMNYMSEGVLAAGFALVAYPEHWDQSGIMTFIVNQDGKVYQQNLGEKTSRIAGAMKEYDPNSQWILVPDDGVPSAVSEK